MYNNFKQKTICSQQHLTCRYIKALCIFAMSLHTIMMIVYMYMCTINPTPTINSSIKKTHICSSHSEISYQKEWNILNTKQCIQKQWFKF